MVNVLLEERDRRWLNIQSELERIGLDGLLVLSDGHLERRGSLRYVSNVWASATLRYGYVVFPQKGEPIGINLEDGWIKDKRSLSFRGGWVGESEPYASLIIEIIRELNIDNGNIGIEGDFMPAPVYQKLVRELPEATFKFSNIVHKLKMIKSPEEISVVEKGAEIVDKAYEACIKFAETGKTWNDITSEVCKVLYQLGIEDIGGYPLTHSNDKIKSGDIYNFYPESQASGGYWIQFGRLISFGEPDKVVRAAWELGIKAQESAVKKLKPGNTGGDLMTTINDALKGSKYTGATRGCGHAIGLDIIERPFISLDDETILKSGMVVAIHPIFSPHPRVFEAVADTFVVTEGEPRKLSKITPEMRVCQERL